MSRFISSTEFAVLSLLGRALYSDSKKTSKKKTSKKKTTEKKEKKEE